MKISKKRALEIIREEIDKALGHNTHPKHNIHNFEDYTYDTSRSKMDFREAIEYVAQKLLEDEVRWQQVDSGIGDYEYWGSKGRDVQIEWEAQGDSSGTVMFTWYTKPGSVWNKGFDEDANDEESFLAWSDGFSKEDPYEEEVSFELYDDGYEVELGKSRVDFELIALSTKKIGEEGSHSYEVTMSCKWDSPLDVDPERFYKYNTDGPRPRSR